MARKKSNVRNLQQEKENLKKKNHVQQNSFPSVSSSVKEEKSSINNKEIHSFETDLNENTLDTSIFYDISNKIDGIDTSSKHANTNHQVSAGRKRHLDESSDLVLNESNDGELIRLKKRCSEIEKRIEVLETTLISYPEHPDMDQNIFDGILKDINDDHIVMNDDKKMSDSNNALNINPEILSELKKDSSNTTARAILKYLYPNPPINLKLSNIDRTIVAGIVDYSMQCHPDNVSTKTQIRRSMSNYFALIRHRKKRKGIVLDASGQNQ